jgi:hypothetical protein
MVLAGKATTWGGAFSGSAVSSRISLPGRPMCVPGRGGGYVGTTLVALAVNEPQAILAAFGPQGCPRTRLGASISSLFVLRVQQRQCRRPLWLLDL